MDFASISANFMDLPYILNSDGESLRSFRLAVNLFGSAIA
jgi:hypothetical protein